MLTYIYQTSGVPGAIPTFERPPRRIENTIDLLFRLDGINRPGLSEAEFRNLFAKCPCGLIMTRRSYRGHVCADATTVVVQNAPVVIDLTLDGDSDTGESLSDSGSASDELR
jgi:hypothetical protein